MWSLQARQPRYSVYARQTDSTHTVLRPAALLLLQMSLYRLGSCCFFDTVSNREISKCKCLTCPAIVSRDQGRQIHLCQLEGVSALLVDGHQVSSGVPHKRSRLRLCPSLNYLQQGQEIQGVNRGCFKCNTANLSPQPTCRKQKLFV